MIELGVGMTESRKGMRVWCADMTVRCAGIWYTARRESDGPHVRLGKSEWQLGPMLLRWWPAGAQLDAMLGARYGVIGSAAGVSEAHGIGQPEAGTLEARLITANGPARFIPTHRGRGLPEAGALPVRSGSTQNPTYFPLTARGLSDFDWLVMMDLDHGKEPR